MPQRVDVNRATMAELVRLPRVGERLAHRIIVERDSRGGFTTETDLLAVNGISESVLADLRPHIRLSAEASDDGVPAAPLFVKLKTQGDADLSGYKVTVRYQGTLAGERAELSATAVAAADGEARGGEVQLRGDGEVSVRTPAGAEVHRDSVVLKNLTNGHEITVPKPVTPAPATTDDPAFGKPRRLRGRVIERNGKRQIAHTQVVVFVATKPNPATGDFVPAAVAMTDSKGYFSTDYVVGSFKRAFGHIAIGNGISSPIRLEDEGSLPESAILVIDAPELAEDEEPPCECEGGLVPRDPDIGDLTATDGTYSQDLGGGCIDFTKPDRVLEEFAYSYLVRTTEPEIKGVTLKPPKTIDLDRYKELIESSIIGAGLGRHAARAFMLRSDTSSTGGTTATPARSIKVDPRVLRSAARSTEALTSVKLDNVVRKSALQELIRKLDLDLLRKPRRNVLDCDTEVDWDEEPTIYQACTIAHGHVLRFKQQWVADGYSLGNLLYSLPLAPAQKKQIAIIDWERRDTATRREATDVVEEFSADLERDRDIVDVVRGSVSETVRAGSSARTSSFSGSAGLAGMVGGIFTGGVFGAGGALGIGGGTSKASSKAWQDSSRKTALDSLNQLRERISQSASSLRSQRSSVVQSVRQGERAVAQTETIANYNHCHSITVQYFEVLRHLLVRQQIVDVQECLFVPLPMTRFDADKALRWRDTLQRFMRDRRLRRGFEALQVLQLSEAEDGLPDGIYADENITFFEGDLRMRFQIARPRDKEGDFEDAMERFDSTVWKFLSFLGITRDPREFYENFLATERYKDRVFLRELGEDIARRFVQSLQLVAVLQDDSELVLPADLTLMSDFVNDRELYVSIRMHREPDPIPRASIKAVRIRMNPLLLTIAEVTGVADLLPGRSRVVIERGRLSYRAKDFANHLFNDRRIDNDIVGRDSVYISTPLDSAELVNPREEAEKLGRELLDHLNEHVERYHHLIWWHMSPNRRYMLLDGFIAPNSGGRSVASVVDNELLALVGNCMVMPVSRGLHLDPTFAQDDDNPIDLLEHYKPTTPIDPMRIALPTKGVYAEAVMGQCNACEKKDETRFWRWEESPIPDSPTAINPLDTGTRFQSPGDLQAKDLPPAIVNFQNVPAAPSPQGFDAAAKILATSSLFKDITGLDRNQQNALAALQAAFAAGDSAMKESSALAQKAGELAMQRAMSRDVDKAMETIKQAKDSGLINQEQVGRLTEQTIGGLIGNSKAGKDSDKLTKEEEVKKAIKEGSKSGMNVEVKRGDEQVKVSVPSKDAVLSAALDLDSGISNQQRFFGPSSHDLTGVTQVEAVLKNAPSGTTVAWRAAVPGTLEVVSPNSAVTEVRGLRPGPQELVCELFDSSGTSLRRETTTLWVPQFVAIRVVGTEFDEALEDIGLPSVKEEVLKTVDEVLRGILGGLNIRVAWTVAPFNQDVPAFLKSPPLARAAFTDVALRKFKSAGLLGETRYEAGGGLGAPGAPGETIEIYPKGFLAPGVDVVQPVSDAVNAIKARAATVIDMMTNWIEFAGRMLGENIAHEILHSLIGFNLPGNKDHWDLPADAVANPGVKRDILRRGADRDFIDRAGVEVLDAANFPDDGSFNDGGRGAMSDISTPTRQILDRHFKLP
ncbi:MAG TPA: helix-hairpin-helix domain-containing protein [Candidatus Sulfomarinibacteraceae bacterium]|nr:helix-hairpin-helix domain-containing protein [Candidatus Sulfomarinibacteraceae bacterium]